MDKSDFKNPSGKLVKNEHRCHSFVPHRLPRKLDLDPKLTHILIESHRQMAMLSGYGVNLPNPHLLIRTHLQNEAVESSKIEGTKATLEDLLRFEAGEEITKDTGEVTIQEVRNYVIAMELGLEDIDDKKRITKSMMLRLHKTLMKDVRCLGGRGQLREVQNFIGISRDIQLASYVPPPADHLHGLLDDLFSFIQKPPIDMPPLVQVALIHYQFEAIHPFLDGNGRISRLLIPLFLCGMGYLTQPLIYLSEYFEKNKQEYYHRLLKVSQDSEWTEYLYFFLKGVDTMATKSLKTITTLRDLAEEYHSRFHEESHHFHQVINFLFFKPVTHIQDIADANNVTYMTARKIVVKLETGGVLSEITGKKRGKLYSANGIIDVISPKDQKT